MSNNKRDIRQLSDQGSRVETGPVQFGDDWPGVFIRGDRAFGLLMNLKNGRDYSPKMFDLSVDAICRLLSSCNVNESVREGLKQEGLVDE